MFIEERHEAILKYLEINDRISIKYIQDTYSVSADSARRDLRILDGKGLIKRTHGGALPVKSVGYTPNIDFTHQQLDVEYENYVAIAKEAALMIKEDDVVYITAGTVGYFMTRFLPRDIRFRVICNSISIAEELRNRENILTFMIGGQITQRGAVKDNLACEFIRNFRIDLSFITSAAISADFGLSIQSTDNVAFIKAVIASSKKVIGLYPVQKVGINSIMKIAEVDSLHTLITDWETSEEELNKLKDTGSNIIVSERP